MPALGVDRGVDGGVDKGINEGIDGEGIGGGQKLLVLMAKSKKYGRRIEVLERRWNRVIVL
jgi:hypothetical protein